jgi:hypothetical protein
MVSRLALLVAAALVAATAAWSGLWFVPFLIGVAAGLLSWRHRRVVVVFATGATTGWALTLWILALRGYPVGATARAIAAFAGLPPYAFVTVMATLLIAFLQALVGAWLARALARRRPKDRIS